jgi:hypothetical protein
MAIPLILKKGLKSIMGVRLGVQNQEGYLLFTISKHFEPGRKLIARSYFLNRLPVKNTCAKTMLFIELAEWSIAAVLPEGSFGKTVDCYRSGGSNPSLSA